MTRPFGPAFSALKPQFPVAVRQADGSDAPKSEIKILFGSFSYKKKSSKGEHLWQTMKS
nr:hypothetical protein [uncultured Oscillibacter sp.]